MPKLEMSGTELAFVHAYVRALRRDYDLLQTVIELMRPDKMAIADIVVATRVANDLEKLFAVFEARLHALNADLKFTQNRTLPQWPPFDALANLFALSFFKVITNAGDIKPKNMGWFSGEPDNWFAIFSVPEAADMQQNMLSSLPEIFYTDLTKAAKKFFSGPGFFANLFTNFKPTSNVWPIPEEYDDAGFADDDEEEIY
jgi:hypothetical protein